MGRLSGIKVGTFPYKITRYENLEASSDDQ